MFHLFCRSPVALCAGGTVLLLASAAGADHSGRSEPSADRGASHEVARAADPYHEKGPSWGPAELVLTGAGCPIETPDGLSLMVATGRPGGLGDVDIWALDRTAVDAPWSVPKHLPEPVNSTAADFCPAPFDRSLYFVSARPSAEACGGGDIYLSHQSPAGDWSEPVHLPCAPDGPNTAGTERSPSLVRTWYGTFLFYSTNQGVAGAHEDIYVSIMDRDGHFGRPWTVGDLSTANFEDQMPTVRQTDDGGFEITFNSDRPDAKAAGGQDIYYATASFLPFWWSKPQNAGPNVNTPANETRATLSYDTQRLYVGRGDVYVSKRQ